MLVFVGWHISFTGPIRAPEVVIIAFFLMAEWGSTVLTPSHFIRPCHPSTLLLARGGSQLSIIVSVYPSNHSPIGGLI